MERMERACCAWFQKIPSLGAKTLFALQEVFGTMEELYKAGEAQYSFYLNRRQLAAVREAGRGISPLAYLEQIEEQGIRYIPFSDDIFPWKLKQIPDPPFGLFVKGALPSGKRPCVAMIGARACSPYGRQVAMEFGKALALSGVDIISGMARGIDGISQRACLDAGGNTYGVLGCGVDICYPKEYKDLYDNMIKQGGVLSAYAPGMPPLSTNFPPRNRIISGLSDVILVIEARRKSGTLITVDMALEQGREVAIIPGRITDELSKGCHALISQGATVIVETEQLLELLHTHYALQKASELEDFEKNRRKNIKNAVSENIYLNHVAKSIAGIMSNEPVEAEVIYQKWIENKNSGSFSNFMEGLMDLELLDLCESNKNRYWIR